MVEKFRAGRRQLVQRQLARVNRAIAPVGIAVAVAVMLVGCGSGLQAPSTPDPPVTGVVTPGATPVTLDPRPSLDDVLWAAELDPQTDAPLSVVSSYSVDAPRLIASVLGANLPAAATIDATWTYNRTSLDAFDTRVVVDNTVPRRWLRFHLERTNPEPWPVGLYAVEISVDGVPARRGEIEVRREE